MPHNHDLLSDLEEPTAELRKMIPDAWSGFAQTHRAVLTDGAIPARIKEVMALSIAVVEQCDGCIAYHAKAAARRKASREEVAEGLGVALLMAGGPATVYAPRAWAAFEEFGEAKTERAAGR